MKLVPSVTLAASCIANRPRTELPSHRPCTTMGVPPRIGPHVHKCDIRHAQHVAAFTYVSCPVIFPLTSVQEHKEDFNDIIHCNGSSSVQLSGSVLESPTFLVPVSYLFHKGKWVGRKRLVLCL